LTLSRHNDADHVELAVLSALIRGCPSRSCFDRRREHSPGRERAAGSRLRRRLISCVYLDLPATSFEACSVVRATGIPRQQRHQCPRGLEPSGHRPAKVEAATIFRRIYAKPLRFAYGRSSFAARLSDSGLLEKPHAERGRLRISGVHRTHSGIRRRSRRCVGSSGASSASSTSSASGNGQTRVQSPLCNDAQTRPPDRDRSKVHKLTARQASREAIGAQATALGEASLRAMRHERAMIGTYTGSTFRPPSKRLPDRNPHRRGGNRAFHRRRYRRAHVARNDFQGPQRLGLRLGSDLGENAFPHLDARRKLVTIGVDCVA